jgi:hypothetical protein
MRVHKSSQTNLTEVLEAVKTGLEEIENCFGWAGFSADEPQSTESVEEFEEIDLEGEDSDDENDDNSDRPTVFSCEEMEVAIDEFLSVLLSRKLIKKNKRSGEPPSFLMALKQLFGKDHDIVEKAKSFEENTKCYFDAITHEHMEQAFLDFVEIQKIIQREMRHCVGLTK